MYAKSSLSRDTRKGYVRNLGKPSVKFYLGHDLSKAKEAAGRLERLWQRVSEAPGGCWDEGTLYLAKAIAKGATTVMPPPCSKMTGADDYAYWLERHQDYADLIAVLPSQPAQHSQAVALVDEQRNRMIRQAEVCYPVLTQSVTHPDETIHKALDAYLAFLEAKNDTSGNVRTTINRVKAIKEHQPDMPLSALTYPVCETWLNHWAGRPLRKRTKNLISPATAISMTKQVRAFWRWLQWQPAYHWDMPKGAEHIKVTIKRGLVGDKSRINAVHIPTFSLDELRIIYQRANLKMKAVILLGLNCGFGAAEIASLRAGEVKLNQVHPQAKKLGMTSTKEDSWVMILRRKTGVYGEWKLWDCTAKALADLLEIHQDGNDYVFQNRKGASYNGLTSGGNHNQRLKNMWANLTHPLDVRPLGLKFLRKTAAQLMREASDGEVTGVFLMHGKPVSSDTLADAYSNRPWKRLHEAISQVGEQVKAIL